MIKLEFGTYFERLEKEKQKRRITNHLDRFLDKYVFFFKSEEGWEYSTEITVNDILEYANATESDFEQVILNFENNYCEGCLEVEKEFEEEEPEETPEEYSLNEAVTKDKIIQQGEEIIEESKTYEEFLTKLFNSFEKGVMRAITADNLNKAYAEKTFGEFLKNLFNVVNTNFFARKVRRFLKIDLTAGLESAEKELNIDIGFTDAFDEKLGKLYAQQIDGYTINGKKWFGIKGVTKEIQSEVIQTVQESISKNLSVDETKAEVRKVFNKFSDWRSEMIARTETNRIVNEGKLLGYKESKLNGGKVVKVALDNRTSCICKNLHKKYSTTPIPLDDLFVDDETNKAFSTPPFHPNCRTTIAFRPN